MLRVWHILDKHLTGQTSRLSAFLILLGALYCCPPSVLSQPFGPPPLGKAFEHLAESLDLDEATQENIRQITGASQDELSQLRSQLHEAYQQMRTLLDADVPDEAAVMQQADTIASIRADMEKTRLRTMLQVRTLLTPEQRAELREKIHLHHPFGPRGPGGGPGPGFHGAFPCPEEP